MLNKTKTKQKTNKRKKNKQNKLMNLSRILASVFELKAAPPTDRGGY